MSGVSEMQFNMLNEITKVAAIKATSALSKMLEFPIGVDIIPVETKNLNQIKHIMEKDEKVVGLSVPILGLLSGSCLLIYPEKSAFSICDIMFHRRDGETKEFSEMEISALTEVANIVIGNFLTSFAMPLQIESLMHRAAHFNHNMLSTFMDEVSNTLSRNVKGGIVVEVAFHFQHVKIEGLGIFLFDEESMIDLITKVNA
jgi:chemotaxis protein CheY-P-specific phosphatase CheC